MSNGAMTLDRKITWGTVLGAIVLIVSLTAWSNTSHAEADKRLSLVEQELELVREMRQDIRDIRDVTVLLPKFMEDKDDEDKRQWDRISELAQYKKEE